MTVVAIKKDKNGFNIAADSATTSGWTIISNADKKSFTKIKQVGHLILAGSGVAATNSILFMYAKTNLIKENSEDAVMEWFKGFLDWKKEKTGNYGIAENNFLVVWGSKAYYFEDFLVTEIKDNFAIGSGRDFALAAMFMGASAQKAVECAINFDSFCGAPIIQFQSKG